ncbi:LysR substrate-binding domain-containing protein [Thalassospira sp.]|uniref:LysR substrate-binding domain-containing protein n=1 Tax=Thalassospira sp. TaxID=1912094 RepID=UPI00261A2052|nr:LysR substrate-binding domain-containing protein [Thalassospira sp.]MCH2273587.1 LysR substrate-binding domain-containing protein [Thalassospira sp.]
MKRTPLPPLNSLRAAEAIGRNGTLLRTADELNVTPGAVSQQLKTLEQFLGLELFARTEKGMIPTEAGQRLLPGLSDAFTRIRDSIAAATRQDENVLTVTTGVIFAGKWLVPRLGRFRDRHPEIDIRISTDNRLTSFDRDDVDIGVRFGRGGWEGLRVHKLLEQQMLPVCAPSLKDRFREPADIARGPRIVDSLSFFAWQDWLDAAGTDEPLSGQEITFSDGYLALEAAMAGHGAMLGWPVIIQDALRNGDLIEPFKICAPTPYAYWLVSSESRWNRQTVRAFRNWIIEEVKSFTSQTG